MERDLNGFPVPSDYQISSRRDALDMAAMAQRAIDAGLFKDRGDHQIDPETHKPQSKWTRKDGMTGQRETWQRQLSGHKASQKRYGTNETAPSGAPAGDESAPVNAGTAAALQGETGHRLNGPDDASPLREVEGPGRQSQPSANPRDQSGRPTPIQTGAAD